MKTLMLSLAAAGLCVPAAPVLAMPMPAATGSGAMAVADFAPGAATAELSRRRDRYDRYGRYQEPRRLSDDERVWRDADGRYRCRRENGTTGLIIGGVVGALAGRAIDTRGDRTVGTVIGAAGGAVAGREIDRGSARCR